MFLTVCGDKTVCVGLHWRTILSQRSIHESLKELGSCHYWFRQDALFFGYQAKQDQRGVALYKSSEQEVYSANVAFQRMLGSNDGLGIFQLNDQSTYVCVACIQGRPVEGFDRVLKSEEEIKELILSFHQRSLGFRLFSNCNLPKATIIEFDAISQFIDDSCLLLYHNAFRRLLNRLIAFTLLLLIVGGIAVLIHQRTSTRQVQTQVTEQSKKASARNFLASYLSERDARRVMTPKDLLMLQDLILHLPLEIAGFGFLHADCNPIDGKIHCLARYRENALSNGSYRGFKSKLKQLPWSVKGYERDLKQVDITAVLNLSSNQRFAQILNSTVNSDAMWLDFGSQIQLNKQNIISQINEFKVEQLPPHIDAKYVEFSPFRYAELIASFPARLTHFSFDWPPYIELKKMAWQRQGEPVFTTGQSFLRLELHGLIYVK